MKILWSLEIWWMTLNCKKSVPKTYYQQISWQIYVLNLTETNAKCTWPYQYMTETTARSTWPKHLTKTLAKALDQNFCLKRKFFKILLFLASKKNIIFKRFGCLDSISRNKWNVEVHYFLTYRPLVSADIAEQKTGT